MVLAQNVLVQVIIMFILIIVGFICSKIKMISENTSAQMSNFLLMVISPCIIIKSFLIDYNKDLAIGLLISVGLAIVTHIIGIIAGKIFFKSDPNNPNYAIERFSVVYSNCGFMAIPLINAVLGEGGVFYASCYIAVFNIFVWTHGVTLMNKSSEEKINLKKILISPNIIAIVIGLILFLLSLKLPSIVVSPIRYIADMNTPLAMVITGIYIERANILSAFKDKKIFLVCLIRLLIVPIIMCAIYLFLDKNNQTLSTIVTANIIAAACPSAASVLLMSTKYNLDAEYASKIVSLSTIFSIVTLPLILWLMSNSFGLLYNF